MTCRWWPPDRPPRGCADAPGVFTGRPVRDGPEPGRTVTRECTCGGAPGGRAADAVPSATDRPSAIRTRVRVLPQTSGVVTEPVVRGVTGAAGPPGRACHRTGPAAVWSRAPGAHGPVAGVVGDPRPLLSGRRSVAGPGGRRGRCAPRPGAPPGRPSRRAEEATMAARGTEGHGRGRPRRRMTLLPVLGVLGAVWWWAAARLATGAAGPVEAAILCGGWGLSLLPVHCVPRSPAGRSGDGRPPGSGALSFRAAGAVPATRPRRGTASGPRWWTPRAFRRSGRRIPPLPLGRGSGGRRGLDSPAGPRPMRGSGRPGPGRGSGTRGS